LITTLQLRVTTVHGFLQAAIAAAPGTSKYATDFCATCVWHAEEGSIRLVGGESSTDGAAVYGRLQINHNGMWGTICDFETGRQFKVDGKYGFNEPAADIACGELGYKKGFSIQPEVLLKTAAVVCLGAAK
jgi:hypothetical protein